MNITAYDFGHIDIAGRRYDADVIIFPDAVRDHWRREEGHSLHIADLADIVAAGPEVLVIGTGYYGRMDVPQETRDYLESNGIRIHAARTGDAVAEFNKLQQDAARVVAALHLTC